MKTIEKNNEIKRVDDITAQSKVNYENWRYCPKSKFKGQNPTVVEEVKPVEVEVKKAPYQKKKKS